MRNSPVKRIFSLTLVLAVFELRAATPPPAPPVSVGEKSVTSTIVITKSGTYDFKKVLHIWKGKSWSCNGEKENGPQILRIEADNVIIKNFHFIGDGKSKGSKGLGDPIHIAGCGTGQGNLCKGTGPRNVTLDGIYGHACEDLMTIGTPGSDNITIQNSYFKPTPSKSNWDKTIQINFGSRIKILNNIFAGGERCIRFKPNTQGEVIGNKFYGCNNAVKASSDDADIAPMKNGPTRVVYKSNKCYDCNNKVKVSGSKTYVEY